MFANGSSVLRLRRHNDEMISFASMQACPSSPHWSLSSSLAGKLMIGRRRYVFVVVVVVVVVVAVAAAAAQKE
jgi:hypothetical protein